MVKVCCVEGCRSGSRADRRERTGAGVRLLSLFRSPKCAVLLDRWRKSLAMNLKATDFVCENHFKDEDIFKGESVRLVDGTVWNQSHLTRKLKREAVPIRSLQEQPINHTITTLMVPDTQQQQQQQLPLEEDASSKECSEGNTDTIHDASNDYCKVSIEPLLANEEGPASITVMEVKNYLEDKLPEAWCWVSTDKGVLFVHFNRASFEKRVSMELLPDLSLTIRSAQGKVIKMPARISSIADLKTCFRELQNLQVCTGVGLEKNRYAAECSGVLEDGEKYQRQHAELRCRACRKQRQRLQMQSSRRRTYVRTNACRGRRLRN